MTNATVKEWDDVTIEALKKMNEEKPEPKLILSAMKIQRGGIVHLYASSLEDSFYGYYDLEGDYRTEQEALEAMNFYVLSEHQDMARFAWTSRNYNEHGTKFGKAYVY